MTIQQLRQGKEIEKKLDRIEDIRNIMYIEHPVFLNRKGIEVNLIGLGEEIEKEFKELVLNFLEKKKEEILKDLSKL